MDITLPKRTDGQQPVSLNGRQQITVVGANGSGKTRFVNRMIADLGNRAFTISALKALYPIKDGDIQAQSVTTFYQQALQSVQFVKPVAETEFEMLLFMLLSYYIPLWLGADEEILADARRYLFFYAAGIPFQTLLTVFSAVLRCAGDTRTPMFVNVGSNFANVVLNFLLIFETRRLVIFGKTYTVYGAGWGVAGAAIATALSYMIAAVVLLTIMFLRASPVQLRRVPCRLSRAVTSRTIRLGLPVALERVATSSGQLVMTGLVTSLGNIALSANHVAVTAEAISYLPANGIAFAGTTVIGQEVGGGEAERAKHDTKTFAALGLLAGLLGGVLLYTQALSLSGIFSPDEEVIQLAGALLRIVAVAEPMFSLTIVLSGVLRGAGKTGAAFWAVAIGMWCVRIPTAMIFLHGLHWGLHGVWFAMVADLITRGVLSIWWVKRIRWERACDDSAL